MTEFFLAHWNWFAAAAIVVATLFSSPLASGARYMASGLANLKLPAIGSSSPPKPTFAEASQSLSLLARYKSLCKDETEYAMVLASLKQLEAS